MMYMYLYIIDKMSKTKYYIHFKDITSIKNLVDSLLPVLRIGK